MTVTFTALGTSRTTSVCTTGPWLTTPRASTSRGIVPALPSPGTLDYVAPSLTTTCTCARPSALRFTPADTYRCTPPADCHRDTTTGDTGDTGACRPTPRAAPAGFSTACHSLQVSFSTTLHRAPVSDWLPVVIRPPGALMCCCYYLYIGGATVLVLTPSRHFVSTFQSQCYALRCHCC